MGLLGRLAPASGFSMGMDIPWSRLDWSMATLSYLRSSVTCASSTVVGEPMKAVTNALSLGLSSLWWTTGSGVT